MVLFLRTERPNGRIGKLEVICHADREGALFLRTAKTILRFINEQLKIADAEEGGVTNYGRLADNEFPKYKSFHVGNKDDYDDGNQ